jgi:hypothetical protein
MAVCIDINKHRGEIMKRMTVRKYDYVLFEKDGKLLSPMDMSSNDVRQVLEWLADLEDALEVEVVKVGKERL